MVRLTEILFWLGLITLAYTYVGYPFLVWVISSLRPRLLQRADFEPTVTVIITAYNEERDLASKLENTLALDYPADKLEVIVASDCSSDKTDAIARAFEPRGVRLHRQPERLGKTAAQNAAVELARGEIILFSDATTLYNQDVLHAMMPNFADATVGCVAGNLVYVDPTKSRTGQGVQSYWGYETFLRRHESRIGSLIGAPGCLYAVRRKAYIPLYHEACSDFIIATKMVEQGLRAVYEPSAVCTEEANTQARSEMRMRIRIIAQTLTDLWRHRLILNPYRGGFYAIQLLSHKVLRYLVPIFMLILLATSAVLARYSTFYLVIFAVQVMCYLLAAIGWLVEALGFRIRLLSLPMYFVLANTAALIAIYKFLIGERYARWDPVREPLDTVAGKLAGTPGAEVSGGGQ